MSLIFKSDQILWKLNVYLLTQVEQENKETAEFHDKIMSDMDGFEQEKSALRQQVDELTANKQELVDTLRKVRAKVSV